MTYNFKRALGIGLALYLGTFVVGIVCGVISGQDMSTMQGMPDSFWYVGMVAAVILTALFSMWYFKSPSVVPSAKSGFLFGLTSVVLAFVLDFILFSLGNMSEDPKNHIDLGQYYGDYRFWIIIVLVIVTAKLVGHIKRPKSPTMV
jgi:heme A synthase